MLRFRPGRRVALAGPRAAERVRFNCTPKEDTRSLGTAGRSPAPVRRVFSHPPLQAATVAQAGGWLAWLRVYGFRLASGLAGPFLKGGGIYGGAFFFSDDFHPPS